MKPLSVVSKKKMLKDMLLIRIAEERLAEIYPEGGMRTPTHFSIGQEAVSVGVCNALKKGDAVFASHRCHAAYLAKGGSLKKLAAELFGRTGGSCRGRSGSAHLSAPENNMYAAPILSAMIPVAAGAALSFKMDKKKNVAAVFFGDAALEEGVFAESVNFAVVKELPVLFVCENNFFSTHTHIKYRQPAEPIFKRVRGFSVATEQVNGNDVGAVYKTALACVDAMRKRPRPYFIECVTYRFREHVGPLYDFQNPYRTEKEVRSWMARCPISNLERDMLARSEIKPAGIEKMRLECRSEVDAAIRFAGSSPWPKKEDLLRDVY